MRIVDQGIPWGVYVAYWRGKKIVEQDSDGSYNVLNIASFKNDKNRISQLIETAKSFGFDEVDIEVEFVEGARQISDEEYSEQVSRLKEGLVPDKYDLGNMIDDYKFRQRNELL
jgi:hypothetical protein